MLPPNENRALHIHQQQQMQIYVFVAYLGCKVGLEELHPFPSKVHAAVKARCPSNTKQLKVYLGLLTYYTKPIITFNTTLQTTVTTKRSYLAMRRRATKCA